MKKFNFKETSSKIINHHFLTKDLFFSIAYLVCVAVFLLLGVASIVAPNHSKYIILGGLIPVTIFTLVPLVLLVLANVADYKKEVYKSWKFWLEIVLFLVQIIGISVCWSFLVPNFKTYSEVYNGLLGSATDNVANPFMNEVRISLWFYMIFLFIMFVSAIVLMIFAWREFYEANNTIITDDKMVQEFIDNNPKVIIEDEPSKNEINNSKELEENSKGV